MEQIPVLFLIDDLYSTHGGAEGILLKMTHLLPRDRFRCSVATFSPDPHLVPAEEFACPVHTFPIRRIYDGQAVRAAFRLSRLMRSERYSIVHTFFPASDLLGGLVAKLSGCPILVSSRRDMGLLRTAAHRLVYRAATGLFDQVHAVGEQVRCFHIEHDGLDPDKVVTLHNGVDLDAIDSVPAGHWPAELAFDETNQVIVCVANVRTVKAIDILVRTAALVCREAPAARFLVVGAVQDAAYFQRVIELANELNVSEKVMFAGGRNDVPPLLKASRIFYLPSRSEGFSNAMLEAMACALPCVATDVGGNCELVDHEASGYLVPTEDPPAAAARILALLRDAALSTSMGAEGRRIVVEKFSVDAMMRKLVALYESLLATRTGRQADKAQTPAWSRAINSWRGNL